MTWTTPPQSDPPQSDPPQSDLPQSDLRRSEFGALSAICAGSGPPVLFLHGVGLRAEAWRRQLDAFAGQYRVIAVDMPGHGESALSDDAMTLPDYGDAIASAISEPALVVGHSMGAMIALDMAIRYPGKVRAVAALNAIFERRDDAAAAVLARAASLDPAQVPDPEPTLVRWFGQASSPERDACRDWLTGVDPAGYKRAYGIFARENGPRREDLRALACPALFITGSEEPNSTPEMSRSMAALAAEGRAIILDGAAHMMPMTHADAVNAALLDFAAGVPG